MSGGRDWSRARDRDRITRQGSENIDGGGILAAPPRPRQSKAELRAELDAAILAGITRIVRCKCGHKASVRLPADRPARLRCTKCGRAAS